MRYKVQIGYKRDLSPRYRYYKTLKAASKFVSWVKQRTGIVLAITFES